MVMTLKTHNEANVLCLLLSSNPRNTLERQVVLLSVDGAASLPFLFSIFFTVEVSLNGTPF